MDAQTAHTTAKDAYDADMSVANATALQTAATDLEAAATAAHTAFAAGASDAQKAAFGDTAVADAAAAVMSADGSVTLANAIVASQGALEAYSLKLTAHETARAAYVADTSVANATALQTAAAALQAATMAAHTAIAAGSTDAQKAAFGDTAVADAATAVAEAATFVIASGIAADEAADALEDVQTAVTTAMTAAGVASGAAQTAATAAQEARANRATMQTGDLHAEHSGVLADKAQEHADAAAAAAKAAGEANEAAMAAMDVTAATRALVMAEAEQETAVKQQMYAEAARDNAVAAAMAELEIVGTVKTVGDTSIDAAASRSVETTGEGDSQQVSDTGLQLKGNQPIHTAPASPGVEGMAGNTDATPNPYVAPVAGAEVRMFPIGKLVDSADDTARLMIVSQYAGSKTVKVYASAGGEDKVSHKPNTVRLRNGVDTVLGTDDDVLADLKLVGTYYRAGTTDTISALPTGGSTVVNEAEGTQVYSFVDDLGNDDAEDDVTRYVVYHSTTNRADGDPTYNYSDAVIHVAVDRDTSDPVNNVNHEVTAKIPEATDYNHIHFGVWAALGAAEDDGSQELSDLGIGFVQSIGDGLSGADMPNGGEAKYRGNWAAAVQAEDDDGDGTISLVSGVATLDADFGEATIDVDLTGLATLTGDIDGNTFSGDEATVRADNMHSLDDTGEFTGSFSGGFYGKQAAEAGGIFDFTSEDAEAGAFRGAFGGDKD